MEQVELEKVHKNLTQQVEKYIKAIIEEYGNCIPQLKLSELESIQDYGKIIKIYETGSINAYASNNDISMPLCADRLLKIAGKIPGYGVYKKHKSYNDKNLITNNNTFINYILHVFISGTNAEGYYEDMLLHETMHFCGSGGATALREGINELLTRKLALKKGFRTNGCGYPKEVHVAYMLQDAFGEDIINQIAFIDSEYEVYRFLEKALGEEAAKLYMSVSVAMEEEFSTKYYNHMDSYDGVVGIIRKTLNYAKIDYSRIYEMIKCYQASKQIDLLCSGDKDDITNGKTI